MNAKIRPNFLFFLLLLAAWPLSACSVLLGAAAPAPEPETSGTTISQTLVAVSTQMAGTTPTPEPTLIPPTETPTEPPASPTGVPSKTPIPTPTPSPIPCDHALFVKDVSVTDGAELDPGESFRKIWRLKNIGSCTWTPEYALVFASGDDLNAKRVIPLSDYVLPGATADLTVVMTAPEKKGSYRGYWLLRNARGLIFGLGNQADGSFWVDIKVREPDRETVYDFAHHYCDAEWETGGGSIGCYAKFSDDHGFVTYLEDPWLENRHENEPTLWVHPDEHSSGWIQGVYPALRIREGDRFRAWVGCMDDNKGCRVDFYLDYQKAGGGPVRNLGTWREAFDGEVTVIDLDLSDLAGRKVHLILGMTVENNKPENANGFWFVPRIDRLAD